MTKTVRLLSGVLVVAAVGLLQGQHQQAPTRQQQVNVFVGPPQPTQVVETPQPQNAVATLEYKRGQDLTARLPPGKPEVTLLLDLVPPDVIPAPDGMEYQEFLTRQADAVAIVKVINQRGELNPQRDWIMSVVEAQVVEVLKPSPNGELKPGQQAVTFRVSGGTANIGDTRVTAVRNLTRQTRSGQTYLVFFTAADGLLYPMGPRGQYEIVGSILHSMDEGPHQTPIHGAEVEVTRMKLLGAAGLTSLKAIPATNTSLRSHRAPPRGYARGRSRAALTTAR